MPMKLTDKIIQLERQLNELEPEVLAQSRGAATTGTAEECASVIDSLLRVLRLELRIVALTPHASPVVAARGVQRAAVVIDQIELVSFRLKSRLVAPDRASPSVRSPTQSHQLEIFEEGSAPGVDASVPPHPLPQ